MINQHRVPLHERGINIDELTFESVAPEGRRVQCVERPDIYLEIVLQYDRHSEAEVLLANIVDQKIRMDPLPSGDAQEFQIFADANEHDVIWIIDKIGGYLPSNLPHFESIDPFEFASMQERTFVLRLIRNMLSHHDRMLSFYAKELGQTIKEDFGIKVGISTGLQHKIELGETIKP